MAVGSRVAQGERVEDVNAAWERALEDGGDQRILPLHVMPTITPTRRGLVPRMLVVTEGDNLRDVVEDVYCRAL